VFPDAKKIGQQLKYAAERGYRVALIAGTSEFERGVWQVKDLAAAQQTEVPEAGLVGAVRAVLAGG
jgi:histidyl-tRNA synthetase